MEKEIIIIGARPYDQVRDLCHRAKAMDAPDLVHTVGEQLSAPLPEKFILLPVPGHQGTAKDTLRLACAVYTAAAMRLGPVNMFEHGDIFDILRCEPHESLCEAKHRNGNADSINIRVKPVTEVQRLVLASYIGEGYLPILVDNVVDTGKTARACMDALGLEKMPVLAIGYTGNHT